MILKQEYNTEHYWIKTKDGCKLDCMLFRQSSQVIKQTKVWNRNATPIAAIDSSLESTPENNYIEDRERLMDQERPTFIICNSNAMIYQSIVYPAHRFYLKLFLDQGCNVFVWNYRGYGRSKGQPTPGTMRSDIDEIYEFLRSSPNIGFKGHIGIYGRSLGGIPASHLARKANMAIVDRTFGTLEDVAQWRFKNSKFAMYLLRLGTCGWQT